MHSVLELVTRGIDLPVWARAAGHEGLRRLVGCVPRRLESDPRSSHSSAPCPTVEIALCPSDICLLAPSWYPPDSASGG